MFKELPSLKEGAAPKYLASGKIYWCKLQKDRHDRGNKEEGIPPNYQAMFVPDNPEEFKSRKTPFLDIMTQVKENPDAKKVKAVQVKRNLDLNPCPIFDAKKNPVSDDISIGNGSDVIFLLVFTTRKGKQYPKANSMQVTKLVPYVAKEQDSSKSAWAFDEVEDGFDSSQVPAKEDLETGKDFNDDIPF